MNKNSVPLAQYYKLYELALNYEGKAARTLVIYFSNLNRFCRFLQAQLDREPVLSDLTEEAVVQYVAYLRAAGKFEKHPFFAPRDEPLNALTIDQHVRTLKGFATWLYEKSYTRANILKKLPRPKTPKLTIEPLTIEEIKRILASVNTRTMYGARNYAIVLVFLDTGLRCSELCNMELEDVHLGGKSSYVKVMGKGQKERLVYLGRRAHEALLQYLTFVRPHYAKSQVVQQFFVNMYGKPLSVHSVQLMMRKVGQAASVPRLHPHLLRHTSATQYLVSGGDVISLQHKLGHSGLEMTNRYVHFAAQELAAIQERVAPMDRMDIKPMKVPRN